MRCNDAELYFPKHPETLPTDEISSPQLTEIRDLLTADVDSGKQKKENRLWPESDRPGASPAA